jgi:hypothetical protein
VILPCGCAVQADGVWCKVCERHESARAEQHQLVDRNLLRAAFNEAARADPDGLWGSIQFTEYAERSEDEQTC